MPRKGSSPTATSRGLRADAQQNRDRILEAGRLAFTRHGAEATLDDIARQAGVGSGTLYRHFATRDALIEAVYRSEVEKLTEAGAQFTATMPRLEALRSWMLLFIDHVAEKKLILPAMETVAGGAARLMEGARGQIHGTFHGLVQRAIEAGELRPETQPEDFVRALVGIFFTTAMPGWEASARRVVDLLIAGSRVAGEAQEAVGLPTQPKRG